MRDDVRDNCLRVLGLAPGASAQEIKAAYRDLAKVWHPDRFAHDPRLQQKAQEQLKEINEAYQRLVSGDFAKPHARPRPNASHEPRDANSPPRAHTSTTAHEGPQQETRAAATTADERVATRTGRRVSRVALAAPALAFCATFAFVTPRLLSTARAPERPDNAATTNAAAREEHDEPARQPADSAATQAETADARAQQKTQAASQAARRQPIDHAEAATAAPAQPVRAMPTVTVSVDPTTGLRARAGCPHKSAMTFPAGDEPTAYCDAHNAPPPQRAAADDAPAGRADDARGKSFAGRVRSSAKKLSGVFR